MWKLNQSQTYHSERPTHAQPANPVACRSEVQDILRLCGCGFWPRIGELVWPLDQPTQVRRIYNGIRSVSHPEIAVARQLRHNITIRGIGRNHQAIKYPYESREVLNRI